MSMPPSVEQTKADPAGLAVDQKGEVELALDAGAVFDIDPVDLLAGRAGLVRDQRAAEHLLGFLGGLLDRLGKAHAALFAGLGLLEVALAAAAGVDLRLDDPERTIHFACRGLGLFGSEDHAAIADRCAVLAKQRLRLVFMNVHENCPLVCCVVASGLTSFRGGQKRQKVALTVSAAIN